MIRYAVVFTLIGFLFYACSQVAVTGRNQLSLVSNAEIIPVVNQQYDSLMRVSKLSSNAQQTAQVKEVGRKIQKAVEQYMAQNNASSELQGFEWEFNLIDDPKTVNAWCMPGGKIVVYTGILPITKDEAGLATVMGHEVAHALVNHGAQRMSAGQLQQLGAVGVAVATSGKSEQTQQILQQAYGLGTEFGAILPFSRKHENEADEIGLILMAIAGYNPDRAVDFWQRMEANSGGSAPPEFLSTHPSGATRMNNIKSNIPKAKKEAAKFGVNF